MCARHRNAHRLPAATHPPCRIRALIGQTAMMSTSSRAASASAARSSGSDVRISSPWLHNATSAASMASCRPDRARSTPADRPRSSSSGATRVPRSAVASRAWRPTPPRHTCATTPPCVSSVRAVPRACRKNAQVSGSLRSREMSAPVSSSRLTGRSQFLRPRPDSYRSLRCSLACLFDFVVGDRPELGFVVRNRLTESPEPTSMLALVRHCLVHPGTHRRCLPSAHCSARLLQQVFIDRQRNPALRHTFIVFPVRTSRHPASTPSTTSSWADPREVTPPWASGPRALIGATCTLSLRP